MLSNKKCKTQPYSPYINILTYKEIEETTQRIYRNLRKSK